MTKNSIKLLFFGFLTGCCLLFQCGASVAQQSAVLDENQKKQLASQINKELSNLKNNLSQYQSKRKSFEAHRYSYKYSESEINACVQKKQTLSGIAAAATGPLGVVTGAATANTRAQKYYEECSKKTETISGSDFISFNNGMLTKKIGWSSDDQENAKLAGISLSGYDFSKTDLHWDVIMNKISDQAAKEADPKAGADKIYKLAEEISNALDEVEKNHHNVQGLLMGFSPSASVTVSCAVSVKEGEQCPPESTVYSIVNKEGRSVSGASKGCTPLPVKVGELQKCILCPLFKVILNTDQTLATKSFGALAPSFRNVIAIALALFIAYHTLITVSAFTKQDVAKYLTTIGVQAFKVFVTVLLLSNPEYVYGYFITPVMSAGMEFGMALLFDGKIMSDFTAGIRNYQSGMPGGNIGTDLLASVMSAVNMFNAAAAKMPAIGSTLVCISTHEGRVGPFNAIPDFSMMLEGGLIYIFGWMIAIGCCFYLLDSVVRFGIFCALVPFIIASWPFKLTAKYTKNGLDIFLNAFFNFVMMGLVISVGQELVNSALSGGTGTSDELYETINKSDIDTLKEMIDISGTGFLILVACCIFALKLVGQVNSLANSISGSKGGTQIGGKIASTLGQAAKSAGQKSLNVGKALGKAAYQDSLLQKGVDKVGQWAGGKKDQASQKIISGIKNIGNKNRNNNKNNAPKESSGGNDGES